jgi:hypothetical protein
MFTDPAKPRFRPFLTPMESLRDDSTYLVRENTRHAIRTLRDRLSKIFPMWL